MHLPRPGALLRVAAILAALPATAAAAIPFESPAGCVVVPAAIEAQPVRLLLDTGDPGGLSLDADTVRRLGLGIASSEASPAARGGLLGPLPAAPLTARAVRLVIDGVSWGAVEAAVIQDAAGMRRAIGAAYDGVIGTALLGGLRLVIDYPAGTIAVEHHGAAGSGSRSDRLSRLRLEGGRFVTGIDLGLGPRRAVIDTGSAATLVDPSGAAGLRPDSAGPAGVVDAGGRSAGLPRARLDRLAAGGTTLRDVPVLVIDLGGILAAGADPEAPRPAAILGADLLSRHRVVIDPGSGRFSLEGGTR